MRVMEPLSDNQLSNYESLEHNLTAKFMIETEGPWVQLQINLMNEPHYVINCIY